MPISPRAKLPLLFSALMGLCVLAADGSVLSGLLRQHADGAQLLFASLFALIVFALWLWGYYRSWRFLSRYAREEAALPQAATTLEAMARNVAAGDWNRPSLREAAPLLDRRLTQMWRALQRGAPLFAGDRADSEERYFPGPEREIRTYRDIALNVGIAGTFVVILITLGQSGLTAESLLTHVGPGMTSGLAAVIANIGLRLCHRALQDEQDALAGQVDETVSEFFTAHLPKALTSPEERLAVATEALARSAKESLEAQTEATQKALTEQTERFDILLKAYGRQIATILLQQVQQPIQKIAEQAAALAEHADAMAQHSGTWAASVADLKTAHVVFLNDQKEGQAQHEQRLTTTFAQYHRALDLSLLVVKQANEGALKETQEFAKRLAALHMQELIEMTSQMQSRYAALQAEQEAVHHRLTETAISAVGGAVDARISTIEERVAATLTVVEGRLPEAVRDGVREGLSETNQLIDSVREQAAAMTHTMAQISGNADRQLQAYEGWHDRALGIQGRLEQVVNDGQAAQAALLARWQTEAGQTLDGVRAAFEVTSREAQAGFSGLASTLDPLTETLRRLQSSTQELNSLLTSLSPRP